MLKKIMIPGSQNGIYVNELDKKGQSLIRTKGISQPRIVNFWRIAIENFKPTIVIDVGVNYGEILYSTVYNQDTLIIGIEANKNFSPYIEKTSQEHPNGNQIIMIYAIAAEKEEAQKDFYIDKLRSGNSTVYHIENRHLIKTTVRSITIDSLFTKKELKDDSVLFKIDVEGYEWNVLKGFFNTLSNCSEFAGCIEFNINFLEKIGVNTEEFLEFLKKHFQIYIPNANFNIVKLHSLTVENLKQYNLMDKKWNDLILFSNDKLTDKLGMKVYIS